MQYEKLRLEVQAESDRKGIYQDGIKALYPKAKTPVRFQILPAFDPSRPDDPQGWLPAINEVDQKAKFYTMIFASKFVGHGNWRSKRQILSLTSFSPEEDKDVACAGQPCPYDLLFKYVDGNPEWGYLTEREGSYGSSEYADPILPKLRVWMLLNVVPVGGPCAGVMIGEFPITAADDLLKAPNKKHPEAAVGLAYEPATAYPGLSDLVQRVPSARFRYGDVTNPQGAPVFQVSYPPRTDTETRKGYRMSVVMGETEALKRVATERELAARRHLERASSFLRILDGQALTDRIAELLRGYANPNGISEVQALQEAVGSLYHVEVPRTPGAVNTVGYPQIVTAPSPSVSNPAIPASLQARLDKIRGLMTKPAVPPPFPPHPVAPKPQPIPKKDVFEVPAAPVPPPPPAPADVSEVVESVPGETVNLADVKSLAAKFLAKAHRN